MSDESFWVDRAQTAEAKLVTLKGSYESALERVKSFKANFGIKERSNGEIVIDYQKFVAALGAVAALELRGIIDEHYQISGKPGKKPRMKVVA